MKKKTNPNGPEIVFTAHTRQHMTLTNLNELGHPRTLKMCKIYNKYINLKNTLSWETTPDSLVLGPCDYTGCIQKWNRNILRHSVQLYF